MLTPVTSIDQIEDAISDRIKTKLANVAGMVAVQKGSNSISQPAVYVSAEEGKFEQEGKITFRQQVIVYVDILFEHLSDEQQRRQGVFMILAAVLQTLMIQDLGLKIQPIKPGSWRNSTSEELQQHGVIAFTLTLETSYAIERLDDEAVTDLLRVGLNYYLKPGDAVADATDTVTL